MTFAVHLFLQHFSQFVHHRPLVFEHGMRVAVERDRRVFVPEDLRERLDVHAALECARREGVAKRMKALVRNVQSLEQQRKSPLVGPDRDVSAASRDDELAIAAPLHLFEQGHDLLG